MVVNRMFIQLDSRNPQILNAVQTARRVKADVRIGTSTKVLR
jgi:hypothetical protein